jgi:hypothetical protein
LTSNITFRFAGDSTRLTRETKKVQSSLKELKDGAAAAFGGSAGSLLKGAGIAAAAAVALDVVTKATTAYYEDIKAQKLLAGQIRNVTGASDGMIAGLDDQIQKLSLATAITDDALRPAYAQLVQSTGSTTEAMRQLTLATNISAGTGKDLGAVAISLGKAYNGNEGALKKLGITIKDTSNITGELEARYAGLAETAASADPMGRMAIQMEQTQERIGAAFAPLVEKFTDWMASPAGVALLDVLVQVADILGATLKVAMDILTPFMPLLEFVFKILQLIIGVLQVAIERIGYWLGEFAKLEFVRGMLQPIMDALGWIVGIVNDALERMGLLKKETMETGPSTADVVSQALAARDKKDQAQRDKDLADRRKKSIDNAKKYAQDMRKHLEESAKGLMEVGSKFKAALDFSFGLDDKNNFSVEKFMEQTKKIVEAARKLPGQLKKLRSQGASDEAIANILAQGPEKGSAIAAGFLAQGGVKGYSEALTSLETSGRQAAAISQSTNTYEININKANMTAEEIIKAIQQYERKTGKKVAF